MTKKKSIFQLLTEKPWEKDQIEADNEHQGHTVNSSKQKLGLRTLMAASTVLFSLFIVAYSDRMLISDWKNMPEPWLLWLNTGILVISSLVFHMTTKYAEKDIFDKCYPEADIFRDKLTKFDKRRYYKSEISDRLKL